MKKLCVLTASLFIISALHADPYGTFTSVTDFEASIKSLVSDPVNLDTKKIYVLEGTIASIDVIDPDPEHFYSEAKFFSSEWVDHKDLKTYTIWLVFGKRVFSMRLPVKGSDNPETQDIQVNTRGLAVVQYLDTLTLPDGTIAYVFNVHDYRVLRK